MLKNADGNRSKPLTLAQWTRPEPRQHQCCCSLLSVLLGVTSSYHCASNAADSLCTWVRHQFKVWLEMKCLSWWLQLAVSFITCFWRASYYYKTPALLFVRADAGWG